VIKNRIGNFLQHLVKDNRGTQLVEFAIVLPILMLLLVGIMEFGRAFFSWVVITNGAREGARYGAIGKSSSEITARVVDTTTGMEPSLITVSTTNAQGTPGTSVTVQVTYSLQIITPMMAAFFPSNPYPLTNTATMRLE